MTITFACEDCARALTVDRDRVKPLRCPNCYAKNEVPTLRKVSRKLAAARPGQGAGAAHYLKALGSIVVGVVLVGVAVGGFVESGGRVVAYGPGAVGLGLVLIGAISAATGRSLSEINNLGAER